MNIFCLIHTEFLSIFLLYSLSCQQLSLCISIFHIFKWWIRLHTLLLKYQCIQSSSTWIGSIVMIYYFKNHMAKKSRTGLGACGVLGPRTPAIHLLTNEFTQTPSFCLIGGSFVLKPQKAHCSTYIYCSHSLTSLCAI